jgi:Do/DeqQ family serine protease
MMRLIFGMVIALALFIVPGMAQTKVAPENQSQILLSFAPVVKKTVPAVVNIYTRTVIKQRRTFHDEFFDQFFGEGMGMPRERVSSSLGSGVIVDQNGLIVTNHHVVRDATDIRVALSDKREFDAKLLVSDAKTDLAVLKIDTKGEDLPSLEFADSDELDVGDLVLAIGNPFGVGQTVTSGIVSALARTQVGVTDYQFFIQTDAAINPGNSGGALVNMQGELIGINTAIYSRSGGSIGIGFSVPSNMVRTVVQSAAGGKVRRPWLGGEFQDVTAEIAESLDFARPEGALILTLHPASPLQAAGLRRGDVIIAVDGRLIENAQELGYRAATARIGETRIVEYRRGSKSYQSNVRMITAPETVPRDESMIEGNSPLQGLVVTNLSPAVAEEMGMSVSAEGVVVKTALTGPAARFFQTGDVLLEVNGELVATVRDLRRVLRNAASYRDIIILRGKRQLRLRLG